MYVLEFHCLDHIIVVGQSGYSAVYKYCFLVWFLLGWKANCPDQWSAWGWLALGLASLWMCWYCNSENWILIWIMRFGVRQQRNVSYMNFRTKICHNCYSVDLDIRIASGDFREGDKDDICFIFCPEHELAEGPRTCALNAPVTLTPKTSVCFFYNTAIIKLTDQTQGHVKKIIIFRFKHLETPSHQIFTFMQIIKSLKLGLEALFNNYPYFDAVLIGVN